MKNNGVFIFTNINISGKLCEVSKIINLSHYAANFNRVSPSTLTSFKATPLYTKAFVVLLCHI